MTSREKHDRSLTEIILEARGEIEDVVREVEREIDRAYTNKRELVLRKVARLKEGFNKEIKSRLER